MEFTAQQIADFLKGTVEGDSMVKVGGFSKIEEGKVGTLSFLANPKYSQYIYDSEASVILVNDDFLPEKEIKSTLIRVKNAYESLAFLMQVVEQSKPKKKGISPLAHISDSAKVGDGAYIEAFVSISDRVEIGSNVSVSANCSIDDDVRIGNNVTIYANVTIYKGCVIGDNCILHAGVRVGSDGFGFAPAVDGVYNKIPQMGNVVIEDDVEIGANTTIDRATLGSTIVRKGVKLDNLIQVAHNVEIGEHTVIASQSGISGSTKIGARCMIAGQVGIAGHIQIADGTMIGAQAGIPNSVKVSGKKLMGSPAYDLGNFQRVAIAQKNLPELQKLVFDLQKQVVELQERLAQ